MRAVKISLRTKILILVGGSLTIACSVLLVMALSMFKADKRAYVFETSASLAGNSAQQIQFVFDGWERAAAATAKELSISSHASAWEQWGWSKLHADLLGAFELGSRDATTFAVSRTLCCTLPDGNAPKFSIDALLPRLNLAQSFAINPAQVLKLVSDRMGEGLGILVVPLGTDGEQERRKLMLVFDLKPIWRIFSNVGGMEVILLDASGRVVLGTGFANGTDGMSTIDNEHAHQDAINSKFAKGAYETSFESGEQYIISYARVVIGRFLVLVRTPNSKAFSATNLLVNRSAAISGIIFSVVLILCLLLVRTMTNEIAKLLSGTLRVAKGQFNEEIQTKSHDEIGVLADSFNIMSKEILRLLEATRNAARMESELATAQLVQENFIPTEGFECLIAQKAIFF